MLRKWGPFCFALFVGIILAVVSILPPSPKGLDSPEDQFSAERAMVDIRVIASEPHPTGSPANAEVRTYLTERLGQLGFEVSTSGDELTGWPFKRLKQWRGTDVTSETFVNVIGVKKGKDQTKPALLLMAHHDTVWDSPGAADDTIGIASIFEIMRALNTSGLAERDIIVLFTDAEEVGLVGAKHFFKTHPFRDQIGAIINFEARGGGGTANMFQTSAQNGNAAKLYAKAVRHPSASSLSTYIYNVLPNDTDLTPALEGDYVAFNIANIGRAEYYHSPAIDADALQVSTVQHMGMQGLDLTKALLSADTFPEPKKDATFFDVFGLFTVVFAPALGWGLVVFTALCLAGTYDSRQPRKDILLGASRMIGFLGLGGVLLFGLNWVSGAGKGADYYDRLAAITELEIMAIFAGLAVFFGMFGRKALTFNGLLGAALPLFALGIAGQALAPTAGYFVVISIMITSVCFVTHRRLNTHWAPAGLAALVVGYMLGLYHLLMVGVGPDLPSVAILPLALLTLAALPFYAGLTKRQRLALLFVSMALALAVALRIRFDPIAATVPTY
ncbi:MAG: M20/M25/M40 family metallo-hydrolase [Litorimonas sp.]